MTVTTSAMQISGSRMNAGAVALTSVRIVLGLVFLLAGASGFIFLFAGAPPVQPGLAGQFQDVFFRSHWVQFVDGIQLLSGSLLLANRYVALALTLLGAVIANILTFHLSMQPQTIGVPLTVLALWMVLAYQKRSILKVLFTR